MEKSRPDFPEWVRKQADANRSALRPESLHALNRLVELYPHFVSIYVNAPPAVDLTVLSTFELDKIRLAHPRTDPILLILRSTYEQFFFITGYQIRELSRPLHQALDSGDFYSSAILARSILEISCCSHYILRRVQTKFTELAKLAENLVKTKSPSHREALRRDSVLKMYEAFSQMQRANTASNFPWAEHLKKFGIEITDDGMGKSLHTGTCIEDIAKAYKLPLVDAYDILSEFVHPNFGSKTLIVGTRKRIDSVTDRLSIGSVNQEEKCLWFIDHLSEAICHTFNLALTFHRGGASVYNFICDISENSSETYH